jgi:hypothetical protein
VQLEHDGFDDTDGGQQDEAGDAEQGDESHWDAGVGGKRQEYDAAMNHGGYLTGRWGFLCAARCGKSRSHWEAEKITIFLRFSDSLLPYVDAYEISRCAVSCLSHSLTSIRIGLLLTALTAFVRGISFRQLRHVMYSTDLVARLARGHALPAEAVVLGHLGAIRRHAALGLQLRDELRPGRAGLPCGGLGGDACQDFPSASAHGKAGLFLLNIVSQAIGGNCIST